MSAGWIGVVVFAVAMVAGVRANYLADRIVDEVQARMESKDRIPRYRVRTWHWYGFVAQHKRLYPTSDLRKRSHLWSALCFGLLLVAVFCFSTSIKSG